MLTPALIPLLARHLGAVDAAVARAVNPHWQEPGLTSLLCDLLDSATQQHHHLDYPYADFLADAEAVEPTLSVEFFISTNQYSGYTERYVTQADLGLVVNYQDLWDPTQSVQRSWLLQAKRAYPGRSGAVDETSRFQATDDDQHARVETLRALFGSDFVRYLLYCPRADGLSSRAAAVLNHARQSALAGQIFDYAMGQAWLQELRAGQTLDAGVFVDVSLDSNASLAEVHRSLLDGAWPLAWFVIAALVDGCGAADRGPFHAAANENARNALVNGRTEAVQAVLSRTAQDGRNPRFLPARTLRVLVTAGRQLEDPVSDPLE